MSIHPESITIEPIRFYTEQTIEVSLLRLDKIHTVISGNKWFKLKEYLALALEAKKQGIITFGGAWSNHIVASAYAARQAGLSSIGMIRGEEPLLYSQSLIDALSYGMELRFLSRFDYQQATRGNIMSFPDAENFQFIPEGGKGSPGISGAASILELVPNLPAFSHICCAVGTGTMLAGLANAALPHQEIIGISSLKGTDTLSASIMPFLHPEAARFTILFDYHFGGYAKHPPALIDFMNRFFRTTQVPTDMVYTSKLMFAVESLLKAAYFPEGSSLLVVHSGGLQGNRSLSAGELIF